MSHEDNIDALTNVSNFLGDAITALDDDYKPVGNVNESQRNTWVIRLQTMLQELGDEMQELEQINDEQSA
jgi:hypothetical protein